MKFTTICHLPKIKFKNLCHLCFFMRTSVLLFGAFLVLSLHTRGQIVQAELNRRMDQAVEWMEKGAYTQADRELAVVLKNLKPLPARMAYYYGRNSYHLGKHKRSINWLNKYIQLQGTKGNFYQETVEFLKLAEKAYLEKQKLYTEEIVEELEAGEIDCNGKEKLICPVCDGTGVLVKSGTFENVYKTCPYSAGEGFLSCEDYILLIQGKLEPKITE